MKICSFCGMMISPHPLHKLEHGVCADCHNETLETFGSAMGVKIPDNMKAVDVIDNNRPKLRGKHMVVQKSKAELLREKQRRGY